MAFEPIPCVACGQDGGGGVTPPSFDTEQLLLCDVGPGGELFGTAMMVTSYDESSTLPTGPPQPYDPATGLPYVVQGTLQPCPTGSGGGGGNDEDSDFVVILCDTALPGQGSFMRRFTIASDGGSAVVTDTELDGVTPFVLSGTALACETSIRDIEVVEVCDLGTPIPTPFMRQLLFDFDGGVAVTGNYEMDGTTPYDVIGPIGSCNPQSVSSARARLLAAGQSWTPGADVTGLLTGVTSHVLSGTATLTDSDGTVSAGLPVGVALSWSVDDHNTLSGPQSITADADSTVLVNWTER